MPAARAITSSPAKRSQASALSRGPASSSAGTGSARTTGIGPVEKSPPAGGRPMGRSLTRPVLRSGRSTGFSWDPRGARRSPSRRSPVRRSAARRSGPCQAESGSGDRRSRPRRSPSGARRSRVTGGGVAGPGTSGFWEGRRPGMAAVEGSAARRGGAGAALPRSSPARTSPARRPKPFADAAGSSVRRWRMPVSSSSQRRPRRPERGASMPASRRISASGRPAVSGFQSGSAITVLPTSPTGAG
jgi:hypothetical protein